MALLSFRLLRNSGLSYLRTRTIMTSNVNLKKVEEELKNNPYFSKYQGKIERLRKENPAEYNARLKAKEEQKQNKDKKKRGEVKYPDPKIETDTRQGKRKNLKDIFKVEMVKDKAAEEIKSIWMDFHKGRDVIFSTYTNEQYQKLNNNYTKYPTFVFPLPRGDGYEFFLCQYSDDELHFTPMAQFKKHGENAPECLSVAYFTDLKDKGIILMRGDYDKDVLSSMEGQCLLNITQLFYSGDSETSTALLQRFNNKPDDFKYPEIISEVERMGFNIK